MRTVALACGCVVRVRPAVAYPAVEYLCTFHGETFITVVRPIRHKIPAQTGSALF